MQEQTLTANFPTAEAVVYLVQIGKHIKIGFSKNLKQRLKDFATSTAETIELLAAIPGDREVERRLHESLRDIQFHREFETRSRHT